MAGNLSYPLLLGINKAPTLCLSHYVSLGDNTISSLQQMDGSCTYSTFRKALNNWLSNAMGLSVSFHLRGNRSHMHSITVQQQEVIILLL